jgi:hypothetical protein
VASDIVVGLLQQEPASAVLINAGKGLFFVFVSSLVLYRLANVMIGRLCAAEQERSRTERETALALARANRFYATLARANEAALTAKDQAELCQVLCQTLIDHAGMRLACIGWVGLTKRRSFSVSTRSSARRRDTRTGW